MLQKYEPDTLYIGFLNSIHHSINKYSDWSTASSDDITKEIDSSNNNKLLYLIDGGTPDLVDHFITLLIYPVAHYVKKYNTKPTIMIVSGDHAGWCTRACLEKVLRWNNVLVTEIRNVTHIK